MVCPACNKAIIKLQENDWSSGTELRLRVIQPKSTSRMPAPADVPTELAEDFNEAAAVLEDSPKASAALSRRCVQGILRLNGYEQKDLAPAIEAILKSKQLPSHLADSLDSIRNVGNFAAHPMKDSNSGAIVPVEPHEADWNLDVLEGLFDFFYVAPAKEQTKRDLLNAKLESVKKPPMKK
ncbi:DUF4145 domain-containing protein [Oxalobacteraceae sp. CFBP 8763]|nr:DUF4145 domain-containing protein [Oxalobacteraceae sp. CFBP 8763]